MQVHLRVRRWVIWWVYIGVVGGAVAGVNILAHNLTARQDELLILLGFAHWLLGGIVCWAFDGVEIGSVPTSSSPGDGQPKDTAPATEFHPASDFLLPGNRQRLLPWRH
jgi:hypothetical protein